IRSCGGWVSLNTEWDSKCSTNIGFGIDDPLDQDLILGSSVRAGATEGLTRTQNEVLFANVFYKWTPQFVTGFEVSYWMTQWQNTMLNNTAPDYRTVENLGTTRSARCEFMARYYF
ncbi:MAG: hypothetical protein ACRCUY_08785, partial [Thermoguttaceae bacterium]